MSRRKTVRVKITMEFDLHADSDVELDVNWLEMVPLMMFSALRRTTFSLGAEGEPTFTYLGGGHHETKWVDHRPAEPKRKRMTKQRAQEEA